MRKIDEKYHIEGDKIIKTSNGQEIPEIEPTFLFRARDHLAIQVLLGYRSLCVVDGCNDYQLEGLDRMIREFERFSEEHPERMKQPGVTRGK